MPAAELSRRAKRKERERERERESRTDGTPERERGAGNERTSKEGVRKRGGSSEGAHHLRIGACRKTLQKIMTHPDL